MLEAGKSILYFLPNWWFWYSFYWKKKKKKVTPDFLNQFFEQATCFTACRVAGIKLPCDDFLVVYIYNIIGSEALPTVSVSQLCSSTYHDRCLVPFVVQRPVTACDFNQEKTWQVLKKEFWTECTMSTHFWHFPVILWKQCSPTQKKKQNIIIWS